MCNNFNKIFLDEAAKAQENSDYDLDINQHHQFMEEAIRLAIDGMNDDGGPFGCVIVKNNEIIGRGNNKVTSSNDPTAHAEVIAIREACNSLKSFQLDGCIIYTSCEPCPMCMGAIYWARPKKVYFANNKEDAAKIGFDDNFIYKELTLDFDKRSIEFEQLKTINTAKDFKIWNTKENKTEY